MELNEVKEQLTSLNCQAESQALVPRELEALRLKLGNCDEAFADGEADGFPHSCEQKDKMNKITKTKVMPMLPL